MRSRQSEEVMRVGLVIVFTLLLSACESLCSGRLERINEDLDKYRSATAVVPSPDSGRGNKKE